MYRLLKMVNTEYELKVFLLDTLEEAKIIADRERLKIFPLYEENSERIII